MTEFILYLICFNVGALFGFLLFKKLQEREDRIPLEDQLALKALKMESCRECREQTGGIRLPCRACYENALTIEILKRRLNGERIKDIKKQIAERSSTTT